jgi:hypothetical protein
MFTLFHHLLLLDAVMVHGFKLSATAPRFCPCLAASVYRCWFPALSLCGRPAVVAVLTAADMGQALRLLLVGLP